MKWKFTPKQRKWIKRLLILFIIRMVLGGILYYVVVYRFKDIMQIMVKRKSKGLYAFDASDIKFSLWNKNIIVEDAVLYCTDTLHTPTHYDLQVPRLYLAIESWTQLILHRRMLVDSLNISMPRIIAHDHRRVNGMDGIAGSPGAAGGEGAGGKGGRIEADSLVHGQAGTEDRHVSFHASRIYEVLQYMVTHLRVKSFALQNGSFQYSSTRNEIPFRCDRINLSILNFSKNDKQSDRLLSSDDVDLTLGPQHWILPDGNHDLRFSRLHFSGKDQLFELDSCTFHSAAVGKRGELSVSAEKFFFNSRDLSAMYEKEELHIDTLFCIRPVLNMQIIDKKNKEEDSSFAINQSIRHLFKQIKFTYIDILDGQLRLSHPGKYQTTNTQKTNLKLFNLRIYPDSAHRIRVDSIALNLRNIRFITPDSLFQLDIDEFSLNNNDLVCNNAVYGPTARNRSPKLLTFTAPSLRLQNISLPELLKRRLKASEADLYNPIITLTDKGGVGPAKEDRRKRSEEVQGKERRSKERQAKKSQSKEEQIAHFYQTLHSLRDLIVVPDFRIVHGQVRYQATGKSRLDLRMKDVSADLLLDRLLFSDSLIDIKRATPELKFGQMEVVAPGMKFRMDNYVFRGFSRHNQADRIELLLAGKARGGGTSIIGKELYWEILDWDLYQKYKLIQIENIRLRELTVRSEGPGVGEAGKKERTGDLPVIHIGLMDIDNLHVDQINGSNSLHFDGRNLCLDHINSAGRYLTWNNGEGEFTHIGFTDGKGLNASIARLNFSNEYETVIEDALIGIHKDREQLTIRAPVVKIKAGIRSTDFSSFALAGIDAANLSMSYKGMKVSKGKGIDSIAFAAGAGMRLEGVKFRKEMPDGKGKSFYYDKANIGLSGVSCLLNGQIDMQIPQASLILTKGDIDLSGNTAGRQRVSLHTGLLFQWSSAAFKVDKPGQLQLVADHLSGAFGDSGLIVGSGTKFPWQSLIGRTTIGEGKLKYKGKRLNADADGVSWDPDRKDLTLRSFRVVPVQSIDSAFRKGAWQADYITASGDVLKINGLQINQRPGDSLLLAREVILDKVTLTTVRDKRMSFRHGVERLMPTRLIASIPYPVRIDTVRIRDSKVMVNEISLITGRQGTIPVESLNADIMGVHCGKGVDSGKGMDRDGDKFGDTEGDSLVIVASARILNSADIRYFVYKEAYGDSLSGNSLRFHSSPIPLTGFSQATIPLAAVRVDRGRADTLYAQWSGNKNGSIGTMDFYYRGLKISILDRKDPDRKRFLLSIVNRLVNTLVLRKNNTSPSVVFFVRDREKFIFNFWVKSAFSGITAGVGVKKNRKLLKRYRKLQKGLSLPANYD